MTSSIKRNNLTPIWSKSEHFCRVTPVQGFRKVGEGSLREGEGTGWGREGDTLSLALPVGCVNRESGSTHSTITPITVVVCEGTPGGALYQSAEFQEGAP